MSSRGGDREGNETGVERYQLTYFNFRGDRTYFFCLLRLNQRHFVLSLTYLVHNFWQNQLRTVYDVGVAEPIRLIFKLKGIPFEDIRLEKDESWATDHKSSEIFSTQSSYYRSSNFLFQRWLFVFTEKKNTYNWRQFMTIFILLG